MRLPDVSSRRRRPIRHAAVCDVINLCCRWIFVTWRGQGASDVSARCMLPLSINPDRPDRCSDDRTGRLSTLSDWVMSRRRRYASTDVASDARRTSIRRRYGARQPWSGLRKRLSGGRCQRCPTPTAASTFDGAVPGPVATDTGAYKLNGDRM